MKPPCLSGLNSQFHFGGLFEIYDSLGGIRAIQDSYNRGVNASFGFQDSIKQLLASYIK